MTHEAKDVLRSAKYLIQRADKITLALYSVATLLEGKTELDETQISGLSAVLDSIASDMSSEFNEHGHALKGIETMLAA